jgi:hypothetical protein
MPATATFNITPVPAPSRRLTSVLMNEAIVDPAPRRAPGIVAKAAHIDPLRNLHVLVSLNLVWSSLTWLVAEK